MCCRSKRAGGQKSPQRRRGGIEPLHVSMPHELRSCPSTSPTHPGFYGYMHLNLINPCAPLQWGSLTWRCQRERAASEYFPFALRVLGDGLLRELNPGPLAPEARIMPLDQAAICGCLRPIHMYQSFKSNQTFNLPSRAVSLKFEVRPQSRATGACLRRGRWESSSW